MDPTLNPFEQPAVLDQFSGSPPRPGLALMDQWVDPDAGNPISGTDKLRSEFFEARDKLKESGNCHGCSLSRLINLFRGKLLNSGWI